MKDVSKSFIMTNSQNLYKSVSIHNRNLQTLATEMFKVTKVLPQTYFRMFST